MMNDIKLKSFIELLNYFNDDQTCIEYLEHYRWQNGIICPFCGHKHVYVTSRGYKCANKNCYKKFTVTVGTIFENSKIKLNIWFAAIYICSSHKKGISSSQLSRDLGITQKTAWFMLHRIREIMITNNNNVSGSLSGIIQADETFVGGKNKNRHKDKKVEHSQGRSYKDKTPVFGLMNDSQVNIFVIKDTKATTLKPIIKSMVEDGSVIVTDEWHGYNNLSNEDNGYKHMVINHNLKEYMTDDGYHTNGIEGFWGLFKRGIYGIYHYVSPAHLDKYCNEFAYRYNTRILNDFDRFRLSLTKVSKSRLTYKRLIGIEKILNQYL